MAPLFISDSQQSTPSGCRIHYKKRDAIHLASILIVDDKTGIRELLHLVTEQLGYTSFQAADGTTALQIVQEKHPDLVILDLKMRGVNGMQFLRQICSIRPNQKVIAVTAYTELNQIQEMQEPWIVASFAKPFDIYELLNEVIKQAKEASNSVI